MKTDPFILDKDIRIFYVTASSFPGGIQKAHETLHGLLPSVKNRTFIAVSRPEGKGVIVYKAGVEEISPGEGKTYGCESMDVKKGTYTSVIVKDYMKDDLSISKAFEQLMENPKLDPQGYCVEVYLNDTEVRCMIRLQS